MNYGIGGYISPHTDSNSWQDKTSMEYIHKLGPRILTFMLYLSGDHLEGGMTVFPQVKVSVKPKMGSVLYWFTIHPNLSYDSRYVHLGCPVVYGNKWILNKWLKLNAQFDKYPCSLKETSNFHILNRNSVF